MGHALARRGRAFASAVFFLTASAGANAAATNAPLSNPLTLDQALALADEPHPDLQLARSGLDLARAQRLAIGARYETRAYLDVTSESADPATGGGAVDDSRARVVVNRPLYDFGYTRALTMAADAGIAGHEFLLLDARWQRRIEIMRRFHDVILADLRYSADLEEMTQRYLTYDRIRERHALGQISEPELLEAENHYREALIQRTASQGEQRTSRLRLALALNRPDAIPNELVVPDLSAVERNAPDSGEIHAAAVMTNAEILSLRKDVDSAQAALDAARVKHRAALSAELEFGTYERPLAARSEARAGLTLRVPLFPGDDARAAVERARAELAARGARLQQAEFRLRQSALELAQGLETLKVERATALQRLAYREANLERRRAMYEMEIQTRLGDAMARLTEAQWIAMKVDLEILLTWARIDALSGKPIRAGRENAHDQP